MVFLGFGYIPENVRLLDPHPNTRYVKQIYGTAFHTSEPRIAILSDTVRAFLSPAITDRVANAQPRVVIHDGMCTDLFDEYDLQWA